MRGYCPKCREYRSDDGADAWGIVWNEELALCQRCMSVVDVWPNSNRGVSSKSSEGKKSRVSRKGKEESGEFSSLSRNVGHLRQYNLHLARWVL